jgi:hypothetical protein
MVAIDAVQCQKAETGILARGGGGGGLAGRMFSRARQRCAAVAPVRVARRRRVDGRAPPTRLLPHLPGTAHSPRYSSAAAWHPSPILRALAFSQHRARRTMAPAAASVAPEAPRAIETHHEDMIVRRLQLWQSGAGNGSCEPTRCAASGCSVCAAGAARPGLQAPALQLASRQTLRAPSQSLTDTLSCSTTPSWTTTAAAWRRARATAPSRSLTSWMAVRQGRARRCAGECDAGEVWGAGTGRSRLHPDQLLPGRAWDALCDSVAGLQSSDARAAAGRAMLPCGQRKEQGSAHHYLKRVQSRRSGRERTWAQVAPQFCAIVGLVSSRQEPLRGRKGSTQIASCGAEMRESG